MKNTALNYQRVLNEKIQIDNLMKSRKLKLIKEVFKPRLNDKEEKKLIKRYFAY